MGFVIHIHYFCIVSVFVKLMKPTIKRASLRFVKTRAMKILKTGV